MEVRIVIIKTDSFTSKQHLLFSLENEIITEGYFPPKIRAMTRMTILAFPSPVSPTYELVVIMDLPDYIFIDPGQSCDRTLLGIGNAIIVEVSDAPPAA